MIPSILWERMSRVFGNEEAKFVDLYGNEILRGVQKKVRRVRVVRGLGEAPLGTERRGKTLIKLRE